MRIVALIIFISLTVHLHAQDSLSFSLFQAKKYAQENSREVLSVMYDLQSAKKKVAETTAIGLPQVNGSMGYQYYIKQPVQLVPAEFFGGPPGEFAELVFGTKQNASAEVGLNQLLFDGSYLVGLQSAKTYVQLTADQVAKAQRDIAVEVEKSYYLVLISRQSQEILQESKGVLERILYETKKLLDEKMIDSIEVDQVELLVNKMNNAINDAERREEVALSLLKFQMGIDLESEISLTDSLAQFIEENTGPQLLSHRFNFKSLIDYQLMETQEQAGMLQVKYQKSKHLPSLGGFFNYRQNAFSNEFDFLSNDAKWFPTALVGVSLNIPIFSGFARSARIQQAQVGLEKVKLMKEQVSQGLQLQVKTAKADYATALENFLNTKNNLRLAKKIRDKTVIKYREGLSASMELSQADNQFFESQSQYLQALYQLLSSRAELEKAMGLNN